MFGMSLWEIFIIAFVAIIFLGPDKLPNAMVEIAKFLKTLKKSLNEAKNSFEEEVKIAELKNEAKKYKETITNTIDRKKLTFEELDEIKNNLKDTKNQIENVLEGKFTDKKDV